MILQGWHVDGYGVLSGHRVDDLEPGLCVVFGPNEAGKSTLLSFVRFTLFGTAGAAALPPLRGGAAGGRVFVLGDDGGRWTVERQGKRVNLLDPQGQPAAESDLARLLGGADARLFRAIFAFDLTELSRFESLTDAGVRDQVFSAGITGAGATASQARQQLRTEREKLVLPRSTQAVLNALTAEWRRVNSDLSEARRATAEYPDLLAREDEARAQADKLAQTLDESGQQIKRLDTLLQLWEPWNRLRVLREGLAAMSAPVVSPDDGVKLAKSRAALDRVREAWEQAQGGQRDLRRQADELSLSPALEAIAARAEAAAATAAAQRQRLEQLEQLQAQEEALQGRLTQRLAALGPGLDVQRLTGYQLPVALADDLRTWRVKAEQAERAVGLAGQDLRQAQEAHGEAAGEADARRGTCGALGGEDEPAVVEARREQLERLERLLPTVRVLPAWLALALAGCAGVAAVVGFRPGPLGVVADLLALVSAAVAIRGLGGQWRDASATAAVCAAGLGLPPRPSPRHLESAHRQLRTAAEGARCRREAAESLAEAEAAAAREDRRRQEAEGRLDKARDAARQLETQWAEWRRTQGLPQGLSPEGCGEFLSALQGAREVAADLEDVRTRRRAGLAAAGAWRGEADALLTAAGRAVPADERARTKAIEVLAADAREATGRRARWDALRDQAEALAPRVAQARRALDGAEAGHAALLASAAVADDASFTRRVDEARDFAQRQRDVTQLDRSLAVQLGEGAYGERLRALLSEGGPAEWEAERSRVRAQLEEVGGRRDAAIETRTLAERRRQEVEASADVAALAARREALRTEIAAALLCWRRLALAERLLDRTLEDYVRDRQPEVLAAASRAFGLVTGGRYGRVVQQVQGDAALAVIDRGGSRRTTRELSRGTAEQLYLALRLGLAESFAARAAALPLVLDDVLVNFDAGRAEAMLRALRTYLDAGGRQAFLFTCHAGTRDMAMAVGRGRLVDLSLVEPVAAPVLAVDAAAAVDGSVPRDAVAPGLEAVAAYFEREGTASARQLQAAFHLDAPAAKRLIRELVDAGRLRSEGHGRGTRYALA